MKDGAYNPKFLELAKQKAQDQDIDLYRSIYETYFQIIKDAGLKLVDENFILGYDHVEYNDGVAEFLEMLHRNGIRNYLLSSGLKVFLEKVSVASYFEDIYATIFTYNQDAEATGFEFLMSDKNKVIAIKEILEKNLIRGGDNCADVVYIGDGLTDYDAMKYVKEHGGTTVFVYHDANSKDVSSIKEENIIDFFAKADFSQNSELYTYMKKLCKIK